MLVEDIMTPEPRFIPHAASLTEAAHVMEEENVGFLPVRDGGQVVGVVTDRDLALRPSRRSGAHRSLRVSDVMSPHAHAVRATASVVQAANAMKARAVRRLLVLDDESRLVGVVSVGDLAARTRPAKLAAEVLARVAPTRSADTLSPAERRAS